MTSRVVCLQCERKLGPEDMARDGACFDCRIASSELLDYWHSLGLRVARPEYVICPQCEREVGAHGISHKWVCFDCRSGASALWRYWHSLGFRAARGGRDRRWFTKEVLAA